MVEGRRRIRRLVATMLGTVAALAVVLVPSGGAVGNDNEPSEVWEISVSLKCDAPPTSNCFKIPGYNAPQLGGAEGKLELHKSLDGTRTWGTGIITFHVHTVDGSVGPHASDTIQKNVYTSWFIANSPLLGRPIFYVNGTRCDYGGFESPVGPPDSKHDGTPDCIPLVAQPTQHPAAVGHYTLADLVPFFDAPPGVSSEINVTHHIYNPQN